MSKIEFEIARDTLAKAVSLSELAQELVAVYASGVMDGLRLKEDCKNGNESTETV